MLMGQGTKAPTLCASRQAARFNLSLSRGAQTPSSSGTRAEVKGAWMRLLGVQWVERPPKGAGFGLLGKTPGGR